ncbi:hypothetical protein QA634_32865 [Methylobacterium sp. CB376]|uniref:hypothetical protein n=1 Tax=unclassified Methylobacterium TaxID=2615210 RepID=UPI000152C5D1|nr:MULTISPECIES: hypothetical protein [Methylobacterium]WFT79923.1 hypothetical protein QA634_32865 [Methylobacterium nodulans]
MSLDLTGVKLVDIDALNGSAGNNYLTGERVYHQATGTWTGITINGYGGNDELTGSDLSDRLDGGEGNDTLIGGSGIYQFRFEAGQGIDLIMDWQDGTDKIVVGPSLSSVDVLNYNGNALLRFDGGSTYALLAGVTPTAMDASDFIFA